MIQLDPSQQRRAEALQKRIEAEKRAAEPVVKPTPPMDAADMRMVSEDLARAKPKPGFTFLGVEFESVDIEGEPRPMAVHPPLFGPGAMWTHP